MTVILKDKGEGDSHSTTIFPRHVPGSVPQLSLPFCSVRWGCLAKQLCSAYSNCVSWQGTWELGGISWISLSDGCLEALLGYNCKTAETTAWQFSREQLMRVLRTSEGVWHSSSGMLFSVGVECNFYLKSDAGWRGAEVRACLISWADHDPRCFHCLLRLFVYEPAHFLFPP